MVSSWGLRILLANTNTPINMITRHLGDSVDQPAVREIESELPDTRQPRQLLQLPNLQASPE